MTDRTAESILAHALNISLSDIAPKISIDSSPSWDSIAHFRVIAAVEEAIGRQLTPEEIFSATDLEGVKQLLLSENQRDHCGG